MIGKKTYLTPTVHLHDLTMKTTLLLGSGSKDDPFTPTPSNDVTVQGFTQVNETYTFSDLDVM
ncbi:MAG: hypothetical protein HUK02_05925 [Bacteroidaceae bacterium]|nr:hypothetical protein [Bacteroidaceae bacterium]